MLTTKAVTFIDNTLIDIGGYGRFQFLLQLVLSTAAVAESYSILLMFFAAHIPPWTCARNSTFCNSTEIFPLKIHENANFQGMRGIT